MTYLVWMHLLMTSLSNQVACFIYQQKYHPFYHYYTYSNKSKQGLKSELTEKIHNSDSQVKVGSKEIRKVLYDK